MIKVYKMYINIFIFSIAALFYLMIFKKNENINYVHVLFTKSLLL